MTIQFESHRVELAAIYELEHNRDVLEYYDQPPTFKLEYCSATGRRLGVLHTADFFVIRETGAGWEEWKTEQELLQLSKQNENRYSYAKEQWVCPPGETYASASSLYYRVRSSSEIDWVYQRNLQFLEDYLRDGLEVAPAVRDAVVARVAVFPGLSLQDVFDANPGVSRDPIYALIAASELHADLHGAPLSEPRRVLLYSTEEEARGQGRTEVPQRAAEIPLMPASGSEASLRNASEAELAVANDRLRHVLSFLGRMQNDGCREVAARTLRRWVAAYQRAERLCGSGYLGLLPRRAAGNATPKLPQETRELICQSIAADYETPKQKTTYACWSALKLACERHGVVAPSYKTYGIAVRNRSAFEQTVRRQGPRAAYSREPFCWNLELTTPVHGDRPFEICHIDHTELDVGPSAVELDVVWAGRG